MGSERQVRWLYLLCPPAFSCQLPHLPCFHARKRVSFVCCACHFWLIDALTVACAAKKGFGQRFLPASHTLTSPEEHEASLRRASAKGASIFLDIIFRSSLQKRNRISRATSITRLTYDAIKAHHPRGYAEEIGLQVPHCRKVISNRPGITGVLHGN